MTASAELHRLAGEIRELPHVAMVQLAKQAKAIAEQEGRRAGPRRMKLTAFTEIQTSGGLTVATMQGVPVGPWVWATTGTKSHSIPKKKGSAKSRYLHARRYEHPIKVPPPIPHPGSGGRNAWTRVQKRVADEVPEVFVKELKRVVG